MTSALTADEQPNEAEARLLRCSEFAGYRCIVGNVVLVRAKHQRVAAACGPVSIVIKYHPGGHR